MVRKQLRELGRHRWHHQVRQAACDRTLRGNSRRSQVALAWLLAQHPWVVQIPGTGRRDTSGAVRRRGGRSQHHGGSAPRPRQALQRHPHQPGRAMTQTLGLPGSSEPPDSPDSQRACAARDPVLLAAGVRMGVGCGHGDGRGSPGRLAAGGLTWPGVTIAATWRRRDPGPLSHGPGGRILGHAKSSR